MNSTTPNFDYEKKRWGSHTLTNFYTDFQGLEVCFLLKDALDYLPKKSSMLDLGCGGGNVAGYFTERFPNWHVTGIDISWESLDLAKKKFPKTEFIHTSAEKIRKPKESYNLITSFDTLEHFDNLDEVLDEVHRLLRKDGVFCVGVPLERQFPTLYWVLFHLGWRGKKHFSGHVNFFDDKLLEKRLEQHGFLVIKKRYSFHFLFSLFDIGFYFLQSLLRKPIAFEAAVTQMHPSFTQKILTGLKKIISSIGFIESRLWWWIPGGKGHVIAIKQSKKDFFSAHPPLTVGEDMQQVFGIQKLLQPRDVIIQRLLKKLQFNKAKHVLDFGCANGIWLERLLVESQAKGTGVDIADALITYANARPNKKGKYYSTMNSWPLKKNTFDFCFSFDTFEHIEKRSVEMKRIYNSMQKGGKFLFYTINPNNKYTIDWVFEKLGSDYMYRRADHKKSLFISPVDLTALAKKEGFKNMDYELYDGPCNLLWRVICFGYLTSMEKVLRFLNLSCLMKHVVQSNDTALRIVMPLNDFIDGFFLRRGYSNGYFLWGEK